MAIIKPHDIVEIKKGVSIDTLFFPEWALQRWQETAYHVVRRGEVPAGKVAIGIRGKTRGERYGTAIPREWIHSVITPESLVQESVWGGWQRQKEFPQIIDSIQVLASLFSKISWGIGGSLGYELATGLPTLSARSDIDIILYPQKKISIKSAVEWLSALQLLPQKIDVQVEGPKGAFHLEEYARGAKKILLKSASGYLLTEDVWDETSD